MNEQFYILIRITHKCVPKGPIDNKEALVQVLAWHGTGWLLPQPMMLQLIDVYMKL